MTKNILLSRQERILFWEMLPQEVFFHKKFTNIILRLICLSLLLHIFRKIPWINIYAEVNQEKEQEMIGSVGQGDSTPKITLSEFSTSKELMEKELDARVKSKWKAFIIRLNDLRNQSKCLLEDITANSKDSSLTGTLVSLSKRICFFGFEVKVNMVKYSWISPLRIILS